MLLRLAYLAVTNAFTVLRLLPMSNRDKDVEILALRHQITVLERQLGGKRLRFHPSDRAFLAAVVWPWRDEPSILAWDLYNEPDFVNELEYQWDAHRANRLDWLARMAAETRRLDHNHLLTIGVALAGSNTQPAGGVSVANLVDFVSVHYYLRNYSDQGPEAVMPSLFASSTAG